MRTVLERAWPLLGLWLVVIAVAVVGSNASLVIQRDTIEVLVNVVLVVGLYAFVGTSGVLSFGQMSFMAIGAYVGALLTIPTIQKTVLLPDLPHWLHTIHLGPVPGAIVAGLVTVALAAVIVVPIARLSGLAASLVMFAVLVIVFQVGSNWTAVTRGSQTMIGVPTNTTIFTALAWAMVLIALAFAYQESASGLRLRASREDDFAARAAGVSIARERAIAFLLSAFITGIGGFLYAQFQGAFTPTAFYLHITFLTIAMLVFGGQKSLAGAVVGAVVISVLSFVFNAVEDGFSAGPVHFSGRDGLSDGALALCILIVLARRREGIMRGRELQWPGAWLRARRAAAATAPVPEPAADRS
jgi:branched-chain amino acid transport system permease protein